MVPPFVLLETNFGDKILLRGVECNICTCIGVPRIGTVFWANQLSKLNINYVFVIWIIWFYDCAIKGEVCSIFSDVFVSLSRFPILVWYSSIFGAHVCVWAKTREMVKQAQ